MPKFIDMTGRQCGWLTVIEYAWSKNGAHWLCKCKCGNKSIARGIDLRQGNTTSCGCKLVRNRFKLRSNPGRKRFQKTERFEDLEDISW